MNMRTRVVIATGYSIIFEELYKSLSGAGMNVVALVTRAGLTEAFVNFGTNNAYVKTFYLPVRKGEMSIPRGMSESCEYKQSVLAEIKKIQAIEHDYLIAWGINVLPDELIRLPLKEAINVHPSDLPDYRGGFPFQAHILNGEKNIRVSIHKTTASIDDGPIFKKSMPIKITDEDTMSSLVNRVVPVGAREVVSVINELEAGSDSSCNILSLNSSTKHAWGIKPIEHPTNCGQLPGSNSGILGYYRIHWNVDSIDQIDKAIRAFDMMNGPFTSINGLTVNLLNIQKVSDDTSMLPGKILGADSSYITVQAKDGVIRAAYASKVNLSEYLSDLKYSKQILDLSVSVEGLTGFSNSDRLYKHQ